MFTSIKALYENEDVPLGQRNFFWKEVHHILGSPDKEEIVTRSLSYLYQRYDYGGHSCGRSLRSLLLESAIREVRAGGMASAGKKIALLVAMYHSHAHIDKSGWYDFPLDFGIYGSSLEERIHLAAVAFSMGVEDQIPDISAFTKEDFFAFLK